MEKQQGFTLIELLIVVAIVGILAAIAIPAYGKYKQDAENAKFIAELRHYVLKAEICLLETGVMLDGGTGTSPAGWEQYASTDKWTGATTIGGRWDFEYDDSFDLYIGWGLGVHFWGEPVPLTRMQDIDETFDDGNLDTGHFRQIANDRFYYYLRESL